MTVFKVSLATFLFASALVLFGLLTPISTWVAGIAAVVAGVALLADK